MGLDYSFNLFFRVQDPWQILDGFGAMAVHRLDAITPVIYPDRIIYLPFEAWAGTETRLPIHYSDRDAAYDFITILSFEPDSELLDYYHRDNPQMPDKIQHVEIGYIYMTLYPNSSAYLKEFDPWLIMVRLAAATSIERLVLGVVIHAKCFRWSPRKVPGCIWDHRSRGSWNPFLVAWEGHGY